MELSIRVDLEGEYGHWAAGMTIPPLHRKSFQPLKTNDERLFAVLANELMDEEAKVVIEARKDSAKIIAEALTKMLIAAMESNDTHNGYRITVASDVPPGQ